MADAQPSKKGKHPIRVVARFFFRAAVHHPHPGRDMRTTNDEPRQRPERTLTIPTIYSIRDDRNRLQTLAVYYFNTFTWNFNDKF